MIFFYLLTLFAGLPVFAYVIAQKTTNKGLIFGVTLIVLIFCVIAFISKYSLLGSFQKQDLNINVLAQIDKNEKISSENFNLLKEKLSEDELKNWLIALISESIKLKKLSSAESLIAFSENLFTTNNEKLIFYKLYTNLRDEKFPEYKDAHINFDKNSHVPCLIKQGDISVFILNAPSIPIAEKKFNDIYKIKISNTDSIIPGFDFVSALLNDESIELKIDITCVENDHAYHSENLIVLDKNSTMVTYKILLNEWLKKPQEL